VIAAQHRGSHARMALACVRAYARKAAAPRGSILIRKASMAA